MTPEKILFALLRNVICGGLLDEGIKAACTPEMLDRVYALAAKHDLAHLVGQAVSKLGLEESDALTKCTQAAMQAVMRYVRLDREYQRACRTLEEGKIPFLPLKGAVLRTYYPEPWMRTSCDVDILVRPEDLRNAITLLVQKLSYVEGKNGPHDVTLHCPGGDHIELHFDLVEEGRANSARTVLNTVWENTKLREGYGYWHEMSDAFFYFYHIAHLAKHVEHGGYGIRAFLDIWILNNKQEYDWLKKEELLKASGLEAFAAAASKLSAYWFGREATDASTLQFEDFILTGGTYGTLKNRIAMQQKKKGGKCKYAFYRIFLSYHEMKYQYPILQKYKYLMPVYQVRRWIRALFKGKAKAAVHELKITAAVELMDYLGLD